MNITKEIISNYFNFYPNGSVEILLILNDYNKEKAYNIIESHIFL